MILMAAESRRSATGNANMSHAGPPHRPAAIDHTVTRPRIDLAQLLNAPDKDIPLIREIAIGHRDPEVRWQCVCALASLGNEAADALTLILRESSDAAVRARANRVLRPITVVLGALVMTGTAFATLDRGVLKETLLRRHARGDWGELCREDWEANERALFENGRLFSVYHDRSGQKFYIITEHDRSITTILLPEDY